MKINVCVANESHVKFAQEICDEIMVSAKERGTGIAKRSPDYIIEKMLAGKAVIAVTDDDKFAGFSYIESWEHKEFVANSGLIIAHDYRGIGLAKQVKHRIFRLSRELFPNAKIFSITTGPAVLKMNYNLGFRPVAFQDLTHDPEFWKGCEGCKNFHILVDNNYQRCICTGLLYDPKDHIKITTDDK